MVLTLEAEKIGHLLIRLIERGTEPRFYVTSEDERAPSFIAVTFEATRDKEHAYRRFNRAVDHASSEVSP